MDQEVKVTESERRQKLNRFVCGLILIQFLVGLFILFIDVLPPTIGIGQFSVAIDFRYLVAGCLGICISLLVLIPLLFAWSDRSSVWRFAVCIPLLALACIVNPVVLLLYMDSGAGGMGIANLLREIQGLSAIAFVFAIGIAVVPLLFRAWRGVGVFPSSLARADDWQDSKIDWLILAIALGVVFFGSPLFDRNTGIGIIAGSVGMAFGGIAATITYWLLREQSGRAFCVAVVAWLAVLVVLPGFLFVLADIVPNPLIPAGSGRWFLGFLCGALALLIHVLLFRGMGYRMKQKLARPVKEPVKTPVVDPFSD